MEYRNNLTTTYDYCFFYYLLKELIGGLGERARERTGEETKEQREREKRIGERKDNCCEERVKRVEGARRRGKKKEEES